MPAFSLLELENFKSYRSLTTIEWKQVSSILGQNGAGKSTIIDAIEYVFCFPPYIKKSAVTLKESLNHKSNEDERSSTWVKATVNINNVERKFKRETDYKRSVQRYWVDDRVVTLQEYTNLLLQVNINPCANNFLVKQNTIEELGLQTAQKRSNFFEKLSGSIEYKPEYDRLVKLMQQIHSERTTLKSILDLHKKEQINLIKRSEQIKLYDELVTQLEQLEFDYHYIKLYEIQTNIDRLLEQKQEKQQVLNKIAKLMQEYKKKIEQYKKDVNQKEQQITDIETKLESCKPELLDYKRKGAELTEKIEFCENEIEKVDKNLKTAENIDSKREQTLIDLGREASNIDKIRNELDKSQSCSVVLDDRQYEEYLRLKAEIQKKLAKESQHMLTLERERKNIEDKINWYEYKEKEISDQIKTENLLLKKIHAQKDNVEKKIYEATSEITNAVRKSTEMDKEIDNLNREVESVIEKIQEYNGQLSDFDVGKEERSRRRRMKEIIDTLKELFPHRVLGQLSHLCEITNREKYGIAITQILGTNMDGIVVDTTNTAIECMQFLKERYKGDKHSALAKFLPLDNCQARTLPKHTLETIESIQYAKLAVNLMKTREIDIVLQYLIGKIVVCETEDQAVKLSEKLNLNCVSLSGTYFKKDGTISGGLSDTKEKAKKWKENEYITIETNKENETQSLISKQQQIREKQNIKREEQTKRLTWCRRLDEYLKPELKKINEEINMKQNNLQKLEDNLNALQKSEIDEWRKSLFDLDEQINNYKQREHEIEDEVFSNFCEELQLESIRKYEENDVRKHKERVKTRTELDNQWCRINNEIKAEESRDTKATITKLNQKISMLKKEWKKLLKERESWEKLESKYNRSVANEDTRRDIRCEKDKIEKKVKFEKRKLDAAKVDLEDYEKTIAALDLRIAKLQRVKIHQILVECKVKGIDIPLEEGTIDKMVARSKIHDTETESSGQQSESDSMIHEKNVKIDFSRLDESIQKLKESDLTIRLNALEVQRKEIKDKVESCIPTNRDLKRELESIEAKIKSTKKDINAKQSECKAVMKEFEVVKDKRKELLMEFCESVENEIDETFKSLYNNAAAQACMTMKNPEEPYLDGIDFGFVIPGKKFTMIEHLSGGERSMCAMAIFLTTYRAKPAPCIIFDEIDAALDNANLQNIVQLYLKLKETTQIISISHHECLFRCSDAAIGINRSAQNESYVIHVDLTPYLQLVDIERTLAVWPGTPSRSAIEVTPTSPEGNNASVALPSLSSSSTRTTVGEPQHSSTPKSRRPTGEESERALTPKNERSRIGEPKHASTPNSSPNSIIGDAQHTSRRTGKIIIRSAGTTPHGEISKKGDPKKGKSDSSEGKDDS